MDMFSKILKSEILNKYVDYQDRKNEKLLSFVIENRHQDFDLMKRKVKDVILRRAEKQQKTTEETKYTNSELVDAFQKGVFTQETDVHLVHKEKHKIYDLCNGVVSARYEFNKAEKAETEESSRRSSVGNPSITDGVLSPKNMILNQPLGSSGVSNCLGPALASALGPSSQMAAVSGTGCPHLNSGPFSARALISPNSSMIETSRSLGHNGPGGYSQNKNYKKGHGHNGSAPTRRKSLGALQIGQGYTDRHSYNVGIGHGQNQNKAENMKNFDRKEFEKGTGDNNCNDSGDPKTPVKNLKDQKVGAKQSKSCGLLPTPVSKVAPSSENSSALNINSHNLEYNVGGTGGHVAGGHITGGHVAGGHVGLGVNGSHSHSSSAMLMGHGHMQHSLMGNQNSANEHWNLPTPLGDLTTYPQNFVDYNSYLYNTQATIYNPHALSACDYSNGNAAGTTFDQTTGLHYVHVPNNCLNGGHRYNEDNILIPEDSHDRQIDGPDAQNSDRSQSTDSVNSSGKTSQKSLKENLLFVRDDLRRDNLRKANLSCSSLYHRIIEELQTPEKKPTNKSEILIPSNKNTSGIERDSGIEANSSSLQNNQSSSINQTTSSNNTSHSNNDNNNSSSSNNNRRTITDLIEKFSNKDLPAPFVSKRKGRKILGEI